MATDWKCEHNAELGLRKEWSERAQKAETKIKAHNETRPTEVKKIIAEFEDIFGGLDLTERTWLTEKIVATTLIG